MKDYAFVIKLAGSVSANSEQEAWDKINSHIDDLGDVESLKYDLSWPDVSWDLEYELC
jgi:hypothetical protein